MPFQTLRGEKILFTLISSRNSPILSGQVQRIAGVNVPLHFSKISNHTLIGLSDHAWFFEMTLLTYFHQFDLSYPEYG
jgi:hypothetical protein